MRVIEVNAEERELLAGIMKNGPEGGYTIGEVRQALTIIDGLQGDAPLTLEDAEWTFLKQRLAAGKWRFADQALVSMVDKIASAEARKPLASDV